MDQSYSLEYTLPSTLSSGNGQTVLEFDETMFAPNLDECGSFTKFIIVETTESYKALGLPGCPTPPDNSKECRSITVPTNKVR